MSTESKDTVIRTIAISQDDDDFLKKNRGSINFSERCRDLIKDLKKAQEEVTPE